MTETMTTTKRVLLMRTCRRADDGTLRSLHNDGSFAWPESGPVEAPDWNPKPVCGFGLHGLLWGVGSPGLWDASGAWVIVEADEASVVSLENGDKVKVPRGDVVHVGDRLSALAYLREHDHLHEARRIYMGIATAGDCGTATAGECGTATAGARGTATAGYYGTATAGDCGTATAGYCGTATAGARGTATAGDCGTATAGDYGTIAVRYRDGSRYRIASADIGDDGFVAGVGYRVTVADDEAWWVRADNGERARMIRKVGA